MPEVIERIYPKVDMVKVGKIIHELHEQVVSKRHRIEITREDCEDCCIMICKSELETLEKALAILADTAAFGEMSASIQSLLQNADVVYSPRVHDQAGPLGTLTPGAAD